MYLLGKSHLNRMSGGLFLVLALLLGLSPAFASEAWFSGKTVQGMQTYTVSVRIRVDSVLVQKGDQRVVDRESDDQVFPALRLSVETQYRTQDTAFQFQTIEIARNVAPWKPIWQNTVRNGVATLEWTRRRWNDLSARTDFHSPVLGDGVHTFEPDAISEEHLYLLAPLLDSVKAHLELKILAPVWEVPYAAKAWKAVANYTGSRLRIEGVDCHQVTFIRSDGAVSEYYVSDRGLQVMRFRTFRGTWFDRFQ